MKQQRVERASQQLGSRPPSDWRTKVRRSIGDLKAPEDRNEDGSVLLLICVIAWLVAVNLILRFPGAAMALDSINQMPLWGP